MNKKYMVTVKCCTNTSPSIFEPIGGFSQPKPNVKELLTSANITSTMELLKSKHCAMYTEEKVTKEINNLKLNETTTTWPYGSSNIFYIVKRIN